MSLVRKIKISKLTNIPLTGRDKDITDYIESKLSDLHIINYQNNNINYFDKDGKLILQYDEDDKISRVDRYDLWRYLEQKYNSPRSEIEILLKYFIQVKLNIPIARILPIYDKDYILDVEGNFIQHLDELNKKNKD